MATNCFCMYGANDPRCCINRAEADRGKYERVAIAEECTPDTGGPLPSIHEQIAKLTEMLADLMVRVGTLEALVVPEHLSDVSSAQADHIHED